MSGSSPTAWFAVSTTALVWGLVVRPDRRQAIDERRRSDLVTVGLTIGILVWFIVSGVMSDAVPGDSVAGSVGPMVVLGSLAALTASQCVTDLVTHRLPRRTSHLTLAVIVATSISATSMIDELGDVTVGAVSMGTIALVVAVTTRGSLGRGDIHFALPLGAAIGAVTGGSGAMGVVGSVMSAWLITAVSAGVVVGALLIARRVARTSHIPYGPFLVLGTLIAVAV